MSLSTAYKRRAASGWPPAPDGTVAAEDRMQIAGWYGMLLSETTVAAAVSTIYAAEHAAALADIRAAGKALIFTGETRTYDPLTGVATLEETTVAGYAIRVQGDPRMYEALGLVEMEAPTLLFAPSTLGERPDIGMTCTWAGYDWVAKKIFPVSPDGTLIVAKVVVAR